MEDNEKLNISDEELNKLNISDEELNIFKINIIKQFENIFNENYDKSLDLIENLDDTKKNIIEYVEEIFILMMIPGFDLLRVAFVRVYNGQHPFLPDRNHIHHLFKNYLTTGYTNLVLFILIALPLLILFIFNSFLIHLWHRNSKWKHC